MDVGIKHISNSVSRSDIILYEYYGLEEVQINKINIKPALTLKSKVVQAKKVHKDTYISDGRK